MENDLFVRILLAVVMAGSGFLMIWMARASAAGRLKRNAVAGIRTTATMASDEAWLAAHIRSKRATLWGGVAALASGAGALLPVPAPALAAIVLAGCAAMLGCAIYGAAVGGRAAKAASKTEDAWPADGVR